MKLKSMLFLTILTLSGYLYCNEERGKYFNAGIQQQFVAAAKNNKLSEVKSLVKKYSDDGGIPAYKHAALVSAAETGHKEVVEYLIEKDTDVNACYRKKTALMWANEKGYKDISKLLIENGAY